MTGVLIVGAGLAGARCAERLRSGGYEGPVRLVGEEPVPPYRRPALSKELLAGTASLGGIQLRPAQWWADAEIELLLGRRVERLDVVRGRVVLRGGSELRAKTLVIATGSHAKRLPGLPRVRGVHTLRSLQDALALRRELRVERRLVIVGAGFVGTEVASTAASLGVAVTIVDPCPPLSRVLGAEVATVLRQRYREHGVDVREVPLDSVEATDRVRRVHLADGATLECDALLVAVGAEPAVPEGLGGTTRGIETDELGRTRFANVYACGDAARSRHERLGRSLRVEHWSDAAAQGIAVADAILGNEPKPRELPFFWSDQFGLRLQYVGHAPEWSRVELDGDAEEFCARYLDDDGRPLAALAANRPRELGTLRRELVEALPQAA